MKELEFTSENLKQLIVNCFDAERSLNDFNLMECSERPVKPVKASISEYNNYLESVKEYEKYVDELVLENDRLKLNIKIKAEELKKLIPEVNIWFITDCGKYAAAIHEYDWGGKNRETLYETAENDLERLLPKLKS